MSTIQSQTIPSAAEMLEMAKLQIVAEAFLEGSLESKDNKVPTPRKMAYFNNDKELDFHFGLIKDNSGNYESYGYTVSPKLSSMLKESKK